MQIKKSIMDDPRANGFFLDVESLLTFKAKEKERDNKNEKER